MLEVSAAFMCAGCRKQEQEAKTKEEEEMAQRVEERVRARVEEAMASEEVQRQIAARLKEERAQLEQKVSFFPAAPSLSFCTYTTSKHARRGSEVRG